MKRVISFLLVLVLCLSMACTAFAAAGSPQNPPPTSNPKTGDIIMFWVLVMVASVVALGAVYFVYRKKFCK